MGVTRVVMRVVEDWVLEGIDDGVDDNEILEGGCELPLLLPPGFGGFGGSGGPGGGQSLKRVAVGTTFVTGIVRVTGT